DSCFNVASLLDAPDFRWSQPKHVIEGFPEAVISVIPRVGCDRLYWLIRVLQLFCCEDESSLSCVVFHRYPCGLLKQSSRLAVRKRKLQLTANMSQAFIDLAQCIVNEVLEL